jgi:hypothetical protein
MWWFMVTRESKNIDGIESFIEDVSVFQEYYNVKSLDMLWKLKDIFCVVESACYHLLQSL